ncbi:hypothetical protein ACOSQ4_006368 [Xanthoceras sorbifolium]
MRIPAKIKMFIWRFYHGWLPALEVFVQRKMTATASCPFCQRHGESILYATWGCPELKLVREACGPAADISFKYLSSPADFLLACFSTLKREELELLFVVLWRCWFRRNKFVHDRFILEPKDVVPWSRFLLEEIADASVLVAPFRSVCGAARIPAAWARPPIGSFKLNTDASVKCSVGATGLGVVIRMLRGRWCCLVQLC